MARRLRQLHRRGIAHALGTLEARLVFAPADRAGGDKNDEHGEADQILAVALPQLGEIVAPKLFVDLAENIAHRVTPCLTSVGGSAGRTGAALRVGTRTSFLHFASVDGRFGADSGGSTGVRALRYRVSTLDGKRRLPANRTGAGPCAGLLPGCWTDGPKSGKLAAWQFDDGIEGYGNP